MQPILIDGGEEQHVIDQIIIAARFIQFAGAVSLFGAPLFLLYGLGAGRTRLDLRWASTIIRISCILLFFGAAASLLGQTASMAGDPNMAFDHDALTMVVTGTGFGAAISVRLALSAILLLFSLVLPARTGLWILASLGGAIILASFAWTGHGAAEGGGAGLVHALSDVIHLIAAGVWLGALAALSILTTTLQRSKDAAELQFLHRALKNFSGIGSLVVAALLASGLVNSWFLVGPTHLVGLFTETYGRLLLAKLALFGLMLLLAAANRFSHTPRLGRGLVSDGDVAKAMIGLKQSVLLEAVIGLSVLALVSIMGTLAPVSAMT